jgi:hypothetical protein
MATEGAEAEQPVLQTENDLLLRAYILQIALGQNE